MQSKASDESYSIILYYNKDDDLSEGGDREKEIYGQLKK